MQLRVLSNQGEIRLPARYGDAGYDIIASEEPKVYGHLHHHLFYQSINYIEYNTKLCVQPKKKWGKEYTFYLLLYPRSSIINKNLILANSVGVIDSGYSGEIKVCFKYIPQPEDMKIISGKTFEGNLSNGILSSINPQKIYHKGDKIAQLIPMEHLDMELEEVQELDQTPRGIGGFGSTDTT